MPKILPRTRVIMRDEGSSSHIENQEEELASRMVWKLKAPKRATMTLKTTDRKQKVVALKRPHLSL